MLRASRAVNEPGRSACRRFHARAAAVSFWLCACIALSLVCTNGAFATAPRSAAHKAPQKKKHAPEARAFREFVIPTGIDRPGGIAVGREGDLWFTETRSNNVGRITQTGKIKLFPLPSHSAAAGIALGPDGNLWFTEASSIGRVTPSGKITQFPIPPSEVIFPTPPPVFGSSPYRITAGPDGNLWFTEWLADKIGRITPSGTITQFQIPTAESHPYGITAGPDGNLWFVEEHGDKIGRITPSGAITEFRTPTRDAGPSYGITTGREGNIWFTEEAVDKIGRITPSGKTSDFPIPTAESQATGITSTANGNLWFTELFANRIGVLNPKLLKCVVPNLRGKTLTQAEQLLVHDHCTLARVPRSTGSSRKAVVVSQSPAARKTLPYNGKVSLRLG
jgi:streptogramin lyase